MIFSGLKRRRGTEPPKSMSSNRLRYVYYTSFIAILSLGLWQNNNELFTDYYNNNSVPHRFAATTAINEPLHNGNVAVHDDSTFYDDTLVPPIWPDKALNEYKKLHSVEALARDVTTRKFALVTYWCPDRAGNILHNMFSTVAWAIMTNRTILYKYEVTDNANVRNIPGVTPENDHANCESILKLKSWVPSWDDWSEKLQLEAPVPIPIDRLRRQYDDSIQTVIFPQINDIDTKNKAIYRNDWSDHPLDNKQYKEYVADFDKQGKMTTGMLYYEGIDYLNGMLFRNLFDMQVDISDYQEDSADDFSLAVHSRHIVVADDGSYVHEETECLRKLLKAKKKGQSCKIYIMSDREKAITLMSEWALGKNCTPVVADHTPLAGLNVVVEHGPYSGHGFIEDLAVASLARHGVVGDVRRSSFKLMQELIAYDREISAWQANRERPDKLALCKLPNRKVSGYDYGPGTPTFIRRRWLPPLEPVGVAEEYEWQHRNGTNSYVVGTYTCPEKLDNSFHGMLNSFLWAMVTNQTFVWQYNDAASKISDAECNEIYARKDWMISYESVVEDTGTSRIMLAMSSRNETFIRKSNNVRIVSSPADFVKSDLQEWAQSRELLTRSERKTLRTLLTYGSDFLYGMLLDRLFKVDNLKTLDEQTIAIMADAGGFEQCMDMNGLSPSCTVLMSTNNINHGLPCQTNITDRLPRTNGYEDNLNNLLHLSQARHAYIGTADTMVIERIEYTRRFDTWALGRVPPIYANFTKCIV